MNDELREHMERLHRAHRRDRYWIAAACLAITLSVAGMCWLAVILAGA